MKVNEFVDFEKANLRLALESTTKTRSVFDSIHLFSYNY